MTSTAATTHQPRTEVRDGMRIDWDVAIRMDDGLVLQAPTCFARSRDGRYPVILTYGPYAKGLAFQDGYPSAWQRMADKHPDVTAGSSNLYQSWEVVDPEKWVPHDYACVRVDSRGCGVLARLHRSFLAARDQGLLRLHRMGRRAAVVERQGRAQRHLLLRHQPVARRLAAAAASRRDVHLGGRRRLVPRHDPSRRHPVDLLGQLVRHAGQDRAVRRGRARQAQPRARRAGVRAGDAVARSSWRRTAPISAARSATIRSTTTITRRARRCGRRSRCRCSRRRTGAARACIRAAISKGSCAPRRSRNGSRRTASSTGRISTPTTAASSSSRFFDHFLHGKQNGWDKRPKVLLQVRHPGEKFVERAENEWPLERTQWTKLYLHPTSGSLKDERAKSKTTRELRRHGRRPHLHDGAAHARTPRSPGRSPPSCSSRPRPATPTCSWSCACSRPT